MMLAEWLVGPVQVGLEGRVGRLWNLSVVVGARVVVCVSMEVEEIG